jgi:hypothetical protein
MSEQAGSFYQRNLCRGVHYSNKGFVKLGALNINRLRRVPIITFYAQNAPADQLIETRRMRDSGRWIPVPQLRFQIVQI